MELTIDRRERVLEVRVKGRLDATTVDMFQEALHNAVSERDRAMIMDLGEVSFINSTGLRAFLMTVKLLRLQSATLQLCALTDSVHEVFRISSFDTIIPIHESMEAARASLSG
ncbi:MAG: STAS domain-containing protein [Gammaproteobacteria bacterium]|nr:STAS domain-containing protein [Gammaproteobacteria bacterium]